MDSSTDDHRPLQTTIDLAARTARAKIQAPNNLALTVKKPVSSPERVLTYGPLLPQGYLGAGVVSLTIPKELGATNTARVSLRIALGGESPANRSTPRSGEGQIAPERQPPTVGDSLGVVREAPVPVHRRMSFTLDAPGFEMAPLGEVPQQVRDGQASGMVLDNYAKRGALGREGSIGLGYCQRANLVHPENVGNGDSS